MKMSDHLIKILWYAAIVFFFMFSMILIDHDAIVQSFVSLSTSIAMAYAVIYSTNHYKGGQRK